MEPVPGVVGQDDAVEALAFGLEIHAPGQNVFVRGLAGTGRLSLVRRLVTEIRPQCPLAQDRCYVHNFDKPERPRLITVSRGKGEELRRRIESLIQFIRDDLAQALSSETIKRRREALEAKGHDELEKVTKPFEDELQEAGLALVRMPVGSSFQPVLLPVIDGEPVAPEQVEALHRQGQLSDEQLGKIQESIKSYSKRLSDVADQAAATTQKTRDAMQKLYATEVRSILRPVVREIEAAVPGERVQGFLQSVVDDVAERFMQGPPEDDDDFTQLYRVNLVLTHAGEDCPVIVENAPTAQALLGTIEVESRPGEPPRSDHMMIRGGSLLAADSGFLILEARDVLSEPGAWKVLMRTLRTGRLEIGAIDYVFPWYTPSLKPDPIDINVKVILLGDADIYYLLDANDPDFPELFRQDPPHSASPWAPARG
ncbi:MAG: ATP-binding protein [Planctomycetota bacterium]